MFFAVLEAYKKGMGKDWAAVERRLEDGEYDLPFRNTFLFSFSVRLRGRKRSMVG